MAAALILAAQARAQNNRGDERQEPGVPHGTYVIYITGLITPPGAPLGTPLVPLAAVGRVTYFANGTDSGVVTASVNGTFLQTPVSGTFTVNTDAACQRPTPRPKRGRC